MKENLDFKLGNSNPSGIGAVIYGIRKSDIVTWPTIVNDQDAEGNAAKGLDAFGKYDGSFTLKEGAKFISIYNTQGEGSATGESVGDTDNKMFTNHLNYRFPANTPNALGFAKVVNNDDCVFIVKSAGQFHVVGSPDYRCTASVSAATGDQPGSKKGITVTADCPDESLLPIYEGKIVLADGELDCKTGKLTPKGE